jgi:anti-anti-sigma factor
VVDALTIEVRRRQGAARVQLGGRLTATTAAELVEVLRPVLTRCPALLELDFADVIEVDTDGLFAVVELHRRAAGRRCQLVVVRLRGAVRDAFASTLIRELVAIEESAPSGPEGAGG